MKPKILFISHHSYLSMVISTSTFLILIHSLFLPTLSIIVLCFLQHTLSLSKQLENYKEYQNKLVAIAGKSNASSIISGGLYLISSGSSDFLQNYYINPLLYEDYTPDQFSDILIESYANFIQVSIFPFFLIKVILKTAEVQI